jgi:hypothetical protein
MSLDDHCRLTMKPLPTWRTVSVALPRRISTGCATPVGSPNVNRGGRSATRFFPYWLKVTDEDPNVSFWVMVFYEKVSAIALTGRKDLMPPRA